MASSGQVAKGAFRFCTPGFSQHCVVGKMPSLCCRSLSVPAWPDIPAVQHEGGILLCLSQKTS